MVFSGLATLLSSTLALHPASGGIDRCSALIGTCGYYQCVEEERLSCGEHGYPLGYGVKYCEKLSALEFTPPHSGISQQAFPGDGNVWRDVVRSCLQAEMDGFFESQAQAGEAVTCLSLRAFAFNSHPRCYTQDVSFCELPPAAVIKVGLTIALKDLLTAESLNQVHETAQVCSHQLEVRIASEPSLLVRLELRKYRAVWDAIGRDPSRASQALELRNFAPEDSDPVLNP